MADRNLHPDVPLIDIGANLGLHSIVMSKCGSAVDAYEPDPNHYDKLMRNLGLNGITNVTVHKAAVSEKAMGTKSSSILRAAPATESSFLAPNDVPVVTSKL